MDQVHTIAVKPIVYYSGTKCSIMLFLNENVSRFRTLTFLQRVRRSRTITLTRPRGFRPLHSADDNIMALSIEIFFFLYSFSLSYNDDIKSVNNNIIIVLIFLSSSRDVSTHNIISYICSKQYIRKTTTIRRSYDGVRIIVTVPQEWRTATEKKPTTTRHHHW